MLATSPARKLCIRALQQREEPFQKLRWRGWTASNVQIDRYYVFYTAFHRIAASKYSAVDCTGADSNHPFRIRCRFVCAQQRLVHVLGHWPSYQEHIGMARRCDETQPETLEIVEGVVEGVDFQLATVARTGIDFANRQ